MRIDKNIAIYRKKYGLTQEELAERCDVSRQAVTKWESGESVPEIDKLDMLRRIFDVTLDDLVYKEIQPKAEPVKIRKERTKEELLLEVKGFVEDALELAVDETTVLSLAAQTLSSIKKSFDEPLAEWLDGYLSELLDARTISAQTAVDDCMHLYVRLIRFLGNNMIPYTDITENVKKYEKYE